MDDRPIAWSCGPLTRYLASIRRAISVRGPKQALPKLERLLCGELAYRQVL